MATSMGRKSRKGVCEKELPKRTNVLFGTKYCLVSIITNHEKKF